MTQLFNNKYRIPSARLKNWNYANEGMYFVTICTKNRENYFGNIIETPCVVNAETQCIASLQPTEIGKIAHSEWYKTMELRPDMKLEAGEFVVMPNHIHGIIIIEANEYNAIGGGRATMNFSPATKYENKFGPQSKNLASIIRGYKSAVTTYARKNGIQFDWQTRFHGHIIRSMDDYNRISNYIIQNPNKRLNDKFRQK
ncbi:MAG: hypothetical protein V4613_08100 [Bacteroidota bacterium]